MSRRSFIEALAGVPLTNAAKFEAVGLDPQGSAPLRRQAAYRRAKEEAEDAADGMDFGQKLLRSIGGAPFGPIGMIDPWVSDEGTPGVREASASNPYGHAGEQGRVEQARLRGENPGGASALYGATRALPFVTALSGAVTPSGIDPSAVGRGALQAVGALATAGLASGGAFAGGQLGGTAGRLAEERGVRGAGTVGSVAGSVVGGAANTAPVIDTSGPQGFQAPASVLRHAGDVYGFPGSVVPSAGDSAAGRAVGASVDALPTVGSSSADLLAAQAQRRRGRFKALMRGVMAPRPRGVSDPFGLIPQIPRLGVPGVLA